MSVMFGELNVLARRHRIAIDRAKHYRWAAWGALLDGHQWEALRYYGQAVAVGDFRSVGRAAVALVRPTHALVAEGQTDAWTREARTWLDELPS
jgi:hypothetical protein